jgi:hypothetical protein
MKPSRFLWTARDYPRQTETRSQLAIEFSLGLKASKVFGDDQAWPERRSIWLAGAVSRSDETFEVASDDRRPICHKQKLDPSRRSSFHWGAKPQRFSAMIGRGLSVDRFGWRAWPRLVRPNHAAPYRKQFRDDSVLLMPCHVAPRLFLFKRAIASNSVQSSSGREVQRIRNSPGFEV